MFLLIVSRFFYLIFRNVTASRYLTWSVCCKIMWVKLLDLASTLWDYLIVKFNFRKPMVEDWKIPILFLHDVFTYCKQIFSLDFSQCNSIKMMDLVCLLWYNVGQVAGLGFKPNEIVYFWISALERKWLRIK